MIHQIAQCKLGDFFYLSRITNDDVLLRIIRKFACILIKLCYNISILLDYPKEGMMQVLSSLKSAKNRHEDCQVVRRRGRIFVICKSNPRFKAVQGYKKKR